MQRKLSHLVLEWIVDVLLPYSRKRCIREAPKDCMSQVCSSQRKVPSYVLVDIYNKVKNKILELIIDEQNVSYCSVTTDMWSSQSMDAYMALTIHFIKKAT